MEKRFDVRVYGAVQGVLFRHSAKRRAEELGLAGFARNEPDGSLAVAVEGEETALREFIAWCRTGPPSARVERVETEEGTPEYLAGFAVLP